MRQLIWSIESAAAIFLLIIAALTAGNVMLRNTADITIPDWYDGSRLMLGIAMFWGIAVTTFRGGHICVDLLWEALGERQRRWLDILATAVGAAFLVPLAVMTWIKVGGSGTQATSDLRLEMSWFYGVAAAGATCAALLAGVRLIGLVRGAFTELRSVDESR